MFLQHCNDIGIELVTLDVCSAKRDIIDVVMEFKVFKAPKNNNKNEKKKHKIRDRTPRFHKPQIRV